MPVQGPPDYQCGELRVCPTLGLVSNAKGESIRLGPVNMKVLAALLAQPGRMVTRSELFEAVWPNQIVSDDALTRCVSDIRGQLRKLSGQDDGIETLPKRGYRWTGHVREAAPAAIAAPPVVVESGNPVPAAIPASSGQGRSLHPVLRLLGRGVTYLAVLVVMASLAVWVIDRLWNPRVPVVAVLPVSAAPAREAAAAGLDRALRTWLRELGSIRVLARSAIDARPDNPFPFFHYEFGARWVIEAEMQESAGQTIVTLAVVDARTGIVETQYSERFAAGTSDEQWLSGQLRNNLAEFIDSQLAR